MALDYGIKVSNLGQGVGTVSDKDVQFTSKYSTLKLYQAGTIGITKPGTATAYGTVSHNLGFEPLFFIWRKFTAENSFLDSGGTYADSYAPIGQPNSWTPESSFNEQVHAYSDSSNIVIAVDTGSGTGTYQFKYYLLVDLANDYSGTQSSITANDYGFKVSKPGVEVKTGKEYEMAYSSKYKALQYYEESLGTAGFSLPLQFANYHDQVVQSGSYIDFYHGLGYPPFYLAFNNSSLFADPTIANEIPYAENTLRTTFEDSSFCNSSFIRLSALRETRYVTSAGATASAEDITFRIIVFTENLSLGTL